MSGPPERFARSPLQTVYLHGLWSLAESVVSRCEAVFDRAFPGGIQVDPQLHADILLAILDAAKIASLVDDDGPRTRNESAQQHQLRLDRIAFFRRLLAGARLRETLARRVRNTLEHFPEYVDRESGRLAAPGRTRQAVVTHNLAVSRRAIFDQLLAKHGLGWADVRPTRLYVTDERRLYNFDWSIDLGALRKEASAILSALQPLKLAAESGEPGGIMQFVPPTEPSS